MKFLPDQIGSYKEQDVQFLVRDISHVNIEKETKERESLIQNGTHYSEMLPVEFQPNEEYIKLFHLTLKEYGERIAIAVAVVAEKIVGRCGLDHLVLASLARAGTPIGVLIKRYIQFKFQKDIPHYSISIIRGRGIDETAIDYIFEHNQGAAVQFVDGWTGKGAITKELQEACELYNATHENKLDAELAVLADPGYCVSIFGTREDFLIPSACLNSTVSGLVSRTVLNHRFMEEGDFHGAKYYKELVDADVSNLYIDIVASYYPSIGEAVDKQLEILKKELIEPTWRGMQSVEAIKQAYDISNTHYIKPGVGETTRVLLRRVPWKILVNPKFDHDLTHIYMLAKERGVPVETYSNMTYSCCGIIKELEA